MLNQKDLRIATLKAAMWESRNIERLLSKAVRSYIDPSSLVNPKRDIQLYFGENGEKEIIVKNVPHLIKDGEVFENLQLTSTIETIIEEAYETLPGVLEFDDLLK
jgi:hypothetical protein